MTCGSHVTNPALWIVTNDPARPVDLQPAFYLRPSRDTARAWIGPPVGSFTVDGSEAQACLWLPARLRLLLSNRVHSQLGWLWSRWLRIIAAAVKRR